MNSYYTNCTLVVFVEISYVSMFRSLYQYLLLYLRCVLKIWCVTRLSFWPVAVLDICIAASVTFRMISVMLISGCLTMTLIYLL